MTYMQKQEAINFLQENLKNKNLIKHCLAVEAAMIALAQYFGEDAEKWGICGLLHDIDYEKTKDNPAEHSKIGAEMLREKGIDSEICDAVLTHNEIHGIEPQTLMAKAVYCLDPLTGLIVAATLILPTKKLNDLSAESVLKRFKEPAFARGANREIIKQCETLLNTNLQEFVKITLGAMQGIASELGL